MRFLTSLSLAALIISGALNVSAAEKILDIDFEETVFSDYFFEKWYSRYDQASWDQLGLDLVRSTVSNSGNYAATYNAKDPINANLGYDELFGNEGEVFFDEHFDDGKFYLVLYLNIPEGNTWEGNNKLMYMGHSGISCQFVVNQTYNGDDDFDLTIHGMNPYEYTLSSDQPGIPDIQDGEWHKIEVFMDWSLQGDGCEYTCDGLTCTATTNPGIYRLWVDDVLEYENLAVVYKKINHGSVPAIARIAIPANHSGTVPVDDLISYIDDIEIWDDMPTEDTTSVTFSGVTIQ